MQYQTAVCFRVSSAQSAEVVKLVKVGRQAMMLGMSADTNDEAATQVANFSCALSRLKGGQAVVSADYAFGKFRFLAIILLVYGWRSYQRVAPMHWDNNII
jgi:phospholipid-translocating ATPase